MLLSEEQRSEGSDWIDRLLLRHGAYWKKARIYDAILLSKYSINRHENLLAAALCFWNSASNTFDFQLGPMCSGLMEDVLMLLVTMIEGRIEGD
ncbi:hypothetical protein L3X38_000042 [Prunus dulcis]|uniref:Uncharacterized protein n=1 Tax=Prunus dulcis TaxID=3755 RepID=A0AAD4YJY5_PRUDU|nr:hypothetical protein L3X38_000042 [Prunus dulcis]